MRLSYNILWIENELDWLEPTIEFAKDIINENGFELNVTIKDSEAGIVELLKEEEPFKSFDLILVDFNLNMGDRGNLIIENIRSHNIFTDVIFYSQDADATREAIKEHWLDGIYCSSRNRNEFEHKFEKVFLTTVKKVQSISSIRGLVLSETSQLDNKIEEILMEFLTKKDSDDILYLKKYIINDLIKTSAKDNYIKSDKLDENIDSKGLLQNRQFDAYKKMRATAKILEILGDDKLITKDLFLKEYGDEVISIRNDLAHANESVEKGVSILKCIKGDRTFNEQECIIVRKNLLKHFGYLDDIRNAIT
ncbi:hypothetical protein [Pedobacter mucosus]|uniref:hypothetical protein n=1 Tax=Pedobacter mucosus TaxID=2895286 RepID=UPI001EE3A3D8|nr:hypothetical protein [Pedobacter mucosus]UKT65059.1 hypothetical protein LOK61_04595 [Pedobacter mucosus]